MQLHARKVLANGNSFWHAVISAIVKHQTRFCIPKRVEIVQPAGWRVATWRCVSIVEIILQDDGRVAVAVSVRAVPVGVRLVHERIVYIHCETLIADFTKEIRGINFILTVFAKGPKIERSIVVWIMREVHADTAAILS